MYTNIDDKLTEEQLQLLYSPVKPWYCETFPTDSIGPDLIETIGEIDNEFYKEAIDEEPDFANEEITFATYFNALENGIEVYDLMGWGNSDSLIRERIFAELADNILNVDYDNIYDMWMQKETTIFGYTYFEGAK